MAGIEAPYKFREGRTWFRIVPGGSNGVFTPAGADMKIRELQTFFPSLKYRTRTTMTGGVAVYTEVR